MESSLEVGFLRSSPSPGPCYQHPVCMEEVTTWPRASRPPPAPPAEDPTQTVFQGHPNSQGGEGSLAYLAEAQIRHTSHCLSKYVYTFLIPEASIRGNSGSPLLSRLTDALNLIMASRHSCWRLATRGRTREPILGL